MPDLDTIYVRKYADRFLEALQNLPAFLSGPIILHVDCAHGIGALILAKLELYFSTVPDNRKLCLHLHNINVESKTLLNQECGADYVKLNMTAPKLQDGDTSSFRDGRWASIDGDGDRLIYFRPIYPVASLPVSCSIDLLDGDRISCLFANFLVKALGLCQVKRPFSIGVVQTAYSNAASTDFLLNQLNVTVLCVPTGVKYLHRAARDFDFGIYFEANGHGTVLFSNAAYDFIGSLDKTNPIRIFADLSNTAVGDAVTGILMVEYALAWLRWSLCDWLAVYTELPSKQIKLPVVHPHVIKTFDSERRVSSPPELQIAIDDLVKSLDESIGRSGVSRAFVRPSGTENIVRIYAESWTREAAEWLAKSVVIITYDLVNGTGPKPELPGPIPK